MASSGILLKFKYCTDLFLRLAYASITLAAENLLDSVVTQTQALGYVVQYSGCSEAQMMDLDFDR